MMLSVLLIYAISDMSYIIKPISISNSIVLVSRLYYALFSISRLYYI